MGSRLGKQMQMAAEKTEMHENLERYGRVSRVCDVVVNSTTALIDDKAVCFDSFIEMTTSARKRRHTFGLETYRITWVSKLVTYQGVQGQWITPCLPQLPVHLGVCPGLNVIPKIAMIRE
ncbi:unnamed protein product [Haemonchus placei]|uniref:Uncharacterized protein n=1 Tax=Haemonchus placei TaxID=6290 RepID=A0A0N4WXU5_HAEPC|nr:unnamed protein product [Haemonchus placei]